jgi:NADH-quinone oxidoreductase subunit I
MFFGSGILKGMMITFKNLIYSYTKKPGEDGALFTTQYPEQRLAPIENYRNLPFLVHDGDAENPRCVACDICAKECPPKCIYIVRDNDENNRPLKRPAIFDIDVAVCMNCGICEEACPFDAIFMDKDFEIATANRQKDFLFTKDILLKPNEYFHKIRPHDAQAIDTKLREAEEKKKLQAEAAAKIRAEKEAKAKEDAEKNPPSSEDVNK